MAKPHYKRSVRVADLIRIEVADILAKKIKDPRIDLVTVTGIDLSPDLRLARIYVTSLRDSAGQHSAQAGLKSALGYIRAELGRRVALRYTPELVFCWDYSYQHATRIEQLLDKVESEGSPDGPDRADMNRS